MTNLTPPSASADDEQDDELDEILYSLIVSYVPHLGNDINKHFYGYKRAKEALAQHTKEAVLKARIDELERLYRVAHRGNFYDAEILYRIAELSAPQQSKETSNE